MRLQGRTVLVTGGTRGIGRAIAQELITRGNRVNFLEEAIPGPRLQAEIATNFTAPVLLTALLLPVLAARSQAAIVNVTSALALTPKASAPVYCASKAALASLTRSFRYQVAGTSVQVLEVMPPLVNTEMAGDRRARKVEPEDVARALVRGLEQNRPEVAVGQARWLKRIHRWAPILAARILRDT